MCYHRCSAAKEIGTETGEATCLRLYLIEAKLECQSRLSESETTVSNPAFSGAVSVVFQGWKEI